MAAQRPLVMLGAAASRPRSTSDLAQFVLRTRIPYFTTQMGKGTVPGGTELYMGTAALSERDYVHDAIDRADLIIAIGHDTIEKPPFIMGPHGPKVVHVGYQPANVEQVYFPQTEVVGDIGPSLRLLADRRRPYCERWRIAAAARGDTQSYCRSGDRRAFHAAAARARYPTSHAPRRHRRARQRHVQNLVRPQLPNPCRQYVAARQCAGNDGRGTAVRDGGGDALSRSVASWQFAATAAS
jgi:thiamine pyrophosphate-dependent acetolactate synthase large subunit-like protein